MAAPLLQLAAAAAAGAASLSLGSEFSELGGTASTDGLRKRHLLVDGTALESVTAGASFVLNPPDRQREPVLQPDWELAPGCGLC
jgi:hypothetical protein